MVLRLLKKGLAYPLQAIAAGLGYGLFALLPIEAASALGGFLCRSVGPRLPVSRVAHENLRRAFPDWGEDRIKSTITAVWDNLGRVAGEFPHVRRLFRSGGSNRIEVVGAEILDRMRDDGRPGLFFSGHYGNWELACMVVALHGMKLGMIYRSASNPLVDWAFRKARADFADGLIRKGAGGARAALETLKKGGHLGMLVDQKMDDGIPVPFFGRPAMTAPALAAMALRFSCPVVPLRVDRLKGVRFRVTVYPPLPLPRDNDRQQAVQTVMTAVNRLIEGWVRERPEQWLWMHRRWPAGPG